MSKTFRTRKRQKISNGLNSLQAFVWGFGAFGQLGLGDNSNRLEPKKLEDAEMDDGTGGMLGKKWHQIACGGAHTVGITPTGDLYSWGTGGCQLGHGTSESTNVPKLVRSICLFGKTVVHASCGLNHTAVVTDGGELYTCGRGNGGQLGHGNLHNLSTFTKVEGLKSHRVVQVACGDEHTLVLTSEGASVYAFGRNMNGETGLGFTEGWQNTPKKVTGSLEWKKVKFVSTKSCHSACITEDGDTYTWGYGLNGRLGHGDEISLSSPKLVDALAGKKAKEVACGMCHTIVNTEDGDVYSFGRGMRGQLGELTYFGCEGKLTPSRIKESFEGKRVVKVACGSVNSLALTSDGCLFSWGCGQRGRLGHGDEMVCGVPFAIKRLRDCKVTQISSYNGHSVALVEDDSKPSAYIEKMKTMIDDETCSDIVFLLKGGERVYANKGLLIAQSEYFRAMFRSGMIESRENKVKVEDCSKAIFLLFIEHLYLGEVDIRMEDAMELFILSDLYQENDLGKLCLEVIESGLSDANAIELLAEADESGLISLKDVCMAHVISNYGSFKGKEELNSLPDSLISELLERVQKV